MIFGWSPTGLFSTPTTSGALRTEGGWDGFAIDAMGLLCFASTGHRGAAIRKLLHWMSQGHFSDHMESPIALIAYYYPRKESLTPEMKTDSGGPNAGRV